MNDQHDLQENQEQPQQPKFEGWQHLGIILIAGIPLWCGMFFYALNNEYTGRLIRVGPAQPLGWMAAIGVVVLAGLAYAGFLSCYWFIPAAKMVLRLIGFGLIVLVLVLPALIIVLLAPAALLLVEQFGAGPPF